MAESSRILSIAILVVHLVVGCCWSHAQGCESHHPSSPTYGGAIIKGQCPECRCDPSHHGPRECQGRKCSFVAPRRPLSGSSNPQVLLFFAVLPNGQFPRPATGLHLQSPATGRHLLPVRLHLANQILLI